MITAQVGSTLSDKIIQISIALDPKEQISHAQCKVHGCGFTIACANYLCEWLKGKTVDAAYAITYKEMVRKLKIPQAKVYAALLAEDAVKTVINRYRGQQHG